MKKSFFNEMEDGYIYTHGDVFFPIVVFDERNYSMKWK